MVNFGLNSASILGIFLAVAGASLYFLRSVRPELSRDHDIFFAAVGLLCGFILLFQGWRLDPILQFGQFLLTGSTIFFAVESIRLRGVATEQARRNTRIVDDERPVSRAYRTTADLDELEPYEEEEYDNPRLRGYPDPRATRSGYDEVEPPRSRSRGTTPRPPKTTPERPPSRSRRPTRPSTPPPARDRYERYSSYDAWEDEVDEVQDKTPPTRKRPSRPRPPESPTVQETPPRARRPRPSRPSPADYGMDSTEDVITPPADYADYVDYQPIEPEELEDSERDVDDVSDVNENEEDDRGLSGSEY